MSLEDGNSENSGRRKRFDKDQNSRRNGSQKVP